LQNLNDQHKSTQLQHASRNIIGFDNGLKESLNTLAITPTNHTGKFFKGAYIQTSNYSETHGFNTIAQIKTPLVDDEENLIQLNPEKPFRYWRVVTQTGDMIEMKGFRFFMESVEQ
jgi:hypothetical protein